MLASFDSGRVIEVPQVDEEGHQDAEPEQPHIITKAVPLTTRALTSIMGSMALSSVRTLLKPHSALEVTHICFPLCLHLSPANLSAIPPNGLVSRSHQSV